MHGCMDAWMDGWVDGWMDGQMDGWMKSEVSGQKQWGWWLLEPYGQ